MKLLNGSWIPEESGGGETMRQQRTEACRATALNETVDQRYYFLKAMAFTIVVLSLFLFTLPLHAKEVQFSATDNCVAYRTNKAVLFMASLDVVGKNCSVKAGATRQDDSYSVEVSIPVDSFDTGNSSRDESVADILKFSESPNLLFKANGVPKNLVDMKSGEGFPLKGSLRIGRVAFPVEFTVKIQGEGSEKAVTGVTVTRFTAFKIEPPTIGPGGVMVKANDYLELHFHILLARVSGL